MELITFEPSSDINTDRCIKCNENIEDLNVKIRKVKCIYQPRQKDIIKYNETRKDALIHVPLCKKHYEYSKNLKDEEKPMGWDYWDILDSLGGFLKT